VVDGLPAAMVPVQPPVVRVPPVPPVVTRMRHQGVLRRRQRQRLSAAWTQRVRRQGLMALPSGMWDYV
jgi:hypothetical protein